jgi:hypothetical protein
MSAWSGSVASPLDTGTNVGTSSASASALAIGSITPNQDGDLIIAGCMFDNNSAGAVSIDTGYTITNTRAYSGGVAVGGSMAYLIQGTAAAINPTWNITNAAAIAVATAAFKTTVASGGNLMRRRLGGVPHIAGGGHRNYYTGRSWG